MYYLMTDLQKHPQTGMVATLAAMIAPYLEFLGLIGQVIVWALGVGVGALTCYAKWLEIKERKRKRNERD
jgi:hypothetical protein